MKSEFIEVVVSNQNLNFMPLTCGPLRLFVLSKLFQFTYQNAK